MWLVTWWGELPKRLESIPSSISFPSLICHSVVMGLTPMEALVRVMRMQLGVDEARAAGCVTALRRHLGGECSRGICGGRSWELHEGRGLSSGATLAKLLTGLNQARGCTDMIPSFRAILTSGAGAAWPSRSDGGGGAEDTSAAAARKVSLEALVRCVPMKKRMVKRSVVKRSVVIQARLKDRKFAWPCGVNG